MSAQTRKKNHTSTIVILSVAGVLIIALGIAAIFSGRVKMNPEGTIGNTAGNLNNSGLFCEYNGTVYFSNTADGGALYAMNPDETDKRRLNTMQVCNILAGGEYLYYFQLGAATDNGGFGSVANTHSFNRCDLDGRNATGITRDVVVCGQLVNNNLYLLTAGKEHPVFYRIKIDKTDQVHLADYNINPACAANGMIYYNGTQGDHALYRLNTSNDSSQTVWADGNLWYPVLDGDYIYYMDVSSDYRLCRYSLSQQAVEILTNDRVDCFNVGYGYIYYQKSDTAAPQLKCMRTDGSNPFVIAEGNYENINITSQYVYFQEFGVDDSLFHSSLGGSWYDEFQ
ncbi:MAG: DUF5050 domain-containing protein [Butyrivibrio sp.]|nr:DUF5050 domain-containing protein [Muribaculum sp.]MCM1551654.1 DUF5050 domain-containing protein [Butyrivibrio sp.]